jgi:MFS family permease
VLARIPDKNIKLVYAAIFLLGLAYGISIALVPLLLDHRGYTKEEIGSFAAIFASGLILLSLPMGAIIKRLSARATLVASLLGYAAAVSIFPFLPGFGALAACRFVDGAFSVGVWVSCETILLSRAAPENKAFVTSLYAISLAAGYVLGPVLAHTLVRVAPMSAAFLIAGALAVIAAALMALRLDPDKGGEAHVPEGAAPDATPPSGYGAVFWRTKCSCLATFSYGYFQAAVVLFMPLYLIHDKGVPESRTILATAVFAAGMLVFSNVLGRLGDRLGHLAVMRALALVGIVMILGFVYLPTFETMCVAVFIAGATLASISPVSLALQGIVTPSRDLARANAIYNAFYAAGMLIGPPVASRIFSARGGAAMLYHLAALWMVFAVVTTVFRRDDPRARKAN